MRALLLSLFPGLDSLGLGFELEWPEATIVRGPDVLYGRLHDVRQFHIAPGVFSGIFGGDPCQAHMRLKYLNEHLGRQPRFPDLTLEFARLIDEGQPEWFLRENSPDAPDITPVGYCVQKLILNNRWIGQVQNRRRGFWFGTRDGRHLTVDVCLFENPQYEPTVLSGHGSSLKIDRGGRPRTDRSIARMADAAKRPLHVLLKLQGLPPDLLNDAPATMDGKKHLVANAVPLPMAGEVARAVKRAMTMKENEHA